MGKIEKVQDKNNELAKDIARQVMFDVVEGTVVDTSKALSNWVATLGNPHSGEIDAHYAGRMGSTEGQSKDVAILMANNAINEKKTGQPIFITNDIIGDKYQKNARILQAAQEAMDDAITAVAKAKVLLDG